MTSCQRLRTAILGSVVFVALTGTGAAQQWTGPDGPNRTIFRSGSVGIGPDVGRRDVGALLQLERGMTDDQPLLSAGSTFRDQTATVLEVTTRRAYVGGPATAAKDAFLPSGAFDLAVNRGVVIGLVGLDERVSTDYRLAVAGKILAEEVRIKTMKDWPDRVFGDDYRLASLPEVDDYIREHQHLPGIPSAGEVETDGIGLADMQSKLLLKIEELTLYMIEQHKTIEGLERKLERLEQSSG